MGCGDFFSARDGRLEKLSNVIRMYFNFFHKNENLRELFLAWVFTVLYVGSCLIINFEQYPFLFYSFGERQEAEQGLLKREKSTFFEHEPILLLLLGL